MTDSTRDLAIRLDWGDTPRRVTARVEGSDRRALPPDAAASVGRALPGLWESDDNDYLRALLTKVLFPPGVRRRFRTEVEALDRRGGTLRIRLRLPLPVDEQPLSLPELRWESVRVPGADAGPGVWDAWVRDPSSAPAPYGELGTDARFTLVREVETPSVTDRRADRPLGPVVIADATGVYGHVRTPTGTHEFPRPGDQDLAAADSRLVETALDGSHLTVARAQSPATADTIRQRLIGAGAFYFGGHHREGGLVVAERPGSARGVLLDGESLSRWLVDHEVPLAVLLACESASGAAATGSASAPLSLAERLARDGVDHVVAVHGMVNHAQAARFAGAFFAGLAQGHDIDVALRRSAGAFVATRAVPVLYTCRRDGDFSVGLRRRPRPSGLSTAAHRIATGADSQATAAPDERFRVSLETRWCLTAPPPPDPAEPFPRASSLLWDVLADPSGGDLAQPLNDFERTLHQTRLDAGLDPFEPRHWYVYDHDEHPDRATAGLTAVLTPPYIRRHRSRNTPPPPDRGVGLVVRKRARAAPDHGFIDDLRQLANAEWDLRMVVVQIHGAGERTDTVREAAQEVARDLGIGEYLLRARTPGGIEEPTAPILPVRSGTASSEPAAELWRTVTDAASSLVAAAAAPLDAEAVVDDLNLTDRWGDVSQETDRLRKLALSWPAGYRKLSAAHAARRVGPARYASLCLAAADDADLGRWLSAGSAGQGLPVPGSFRGLRLESGVVDAFVLGLLRTGADHDAVFAAWEREGPSPAVRRALEVARVRSADGAAHITEAELWDADVAIALDRAGLVRRDIRELDPGGGCPGSWALLARRRPTEADARWLCGMKPAMRRLAGLEPDDGPYDHRHQRNLLEHRGALRPLLPQPGGSTVLHG
ncbi:CHAT domain-containing protein [Streptomyces zaehneri]|uniref:CHAT domain-containing protein n=1 Tax=Streptomyces zaehneri TaxID=3051180 RepID=UPI0028D64A0A|nr:CHAT domain-containing protein [Streptomyces sp. DSM 40713]